MGRRTTSTARRAPAARRGEAEARQRVTSTPFRSRGSASSPASASPWVRMSPFASTIGPSPSRAIAAIARMSSASPPEAWTSTSPKCAATGPVHCGRVITWTSPAPERLELRAQRAPSVVPSKGSAAAGPSPAAGAVARSTAVKPRAVAARRGDGGTVLGWGLTWGGRRRRGECAILDSAGAFPHRATPRWHRAAPPTDSTLTASTPQTTAPATPAGAPATGRARRILVPLLVIAGVAALLALGFDRYLNYDARYALLWARDLVRRGHARLHGRLRPDAASAGDRGSRCSPSRSGTVPTRC